MLRKCGRCGAMKSIADFAGVPRRVGNSTATADHVGPSTAESTTSRTDSRYIDQMMRRKQELRATNYRLLIEFLRARPCVDCGETDVLVLEFDHIAGKSFLIAAALRDRFWSDILVEIAKCDVVCANCHRRRTAQRGRWARFVAARRVDGAGA